jgi:DNA-binding SARP family transcriptional activator
MAEAGPVQQRRYNGRQHQSLLSRAHATSLLILPCFCLTSASTMASPDYPSGLYLKTFGQPALLRDGEPIEKVRLKDLALLIFLRLECERTHHRKDLADMLFRADRDPLQRLYNANGRLKEIRDDLILPHSYGHIQGNCRLPCDTSELLDAHRSGVYEQLVLDRYLGSFLEGFTLADGADGFGYWKTKQWTRLRVAIEPIWRRSLELAAARCDWVTVRDRALDVLEADPDSVEIRKLVLQAWLELREFEKAEANYERYRLALGRLGEEPASELADVITEIRRRKALAGAALVPGSAARQLETSFSHVESSGQLYADTPGVDVFLSAAMASTESREQYEIERAQAMLMVHAIRDLGNTVYFAGEERPSPDTFEDESDALEEVFATVRRCRMLILFYPKKRPSSSLIELGMAMALGKRCVVLVSKRSDLPFLLISPTRHYPPIEIFRYRDVNDVLKYLRRNLAQFLTAGFPKPVSP